MDISCTSNYSDSLGEKEPSKFKPFDLGLQEENKRLKDDLEFHKEGEQTWFSIAKDYHKQNAELLDALKIILKYDYDHLCKHRVSALTADISDMIKSLINKYRPS